MSSPHKPKPDWRKALRPKNEGVPPSPKKSAFKKPGSPVAKVSKTEKVEVPVAKAAPPEPPKLPSSDEGLDQLVISVLGLNKGKNPPPATKALPTPTNLSSGIVSTPPPPVQTQVSLPTQAPPRLPSSIGQASQLPRASPPVSTMALPSSSPNVSSPNIGPVVDQVNAKLRQAENQITALQIQIQQQADAFRKELNDLKNRPVPTAVVPSDVASNKKVDDIEVRIKELDNRVRDLRTLKGARCTTSETEVPICDRVSSLEQKLTSLLGAEGSSLVRGQEETCSVATGAVPLFVTRSLVRRPEPEIERGGGST